MSQLPEDVSLTDRVKCLESLFGRLHHLAFQRPFDPVEDIAYTALDAALEEERTFLRQINREIDAIHVKRGVEIDDLREKHAHKKHDLRAKSEKAGLAAGRKF